MSANDRQVGGSHYKKGGEEHWDRAWRLEYDCFQYIITKWVERWRDKGGLEDLYKARHALDKYIEVVEKKGDQNEMAYCDVCGDPWQKWQLGIHRGNPKWMECPKCAERSFYEFINDQCEAGPEYVNQD